MTQKMVVTKIAYCGRRFGNGGRSFDAFAIARDPDAIGDELYYKAARRCRFIIGQIYKGELSENHTLNFSSFELVDGERVSPALIDQWSADDAIARRAKIDESTRKKLQAEYRNKWLEHLEPLRRQYREMSAAQRRAMRQLLIEWIEARP